VTTSLIDLATSMEVHSGLRICPKRMIPGRKALPDLTVTGASALSPTRQQCIQLRCSVLLAHDAITTSLGSAGWETGPRAFITGASAEQPMLHMESVLVHATICSLPHLSRSDEWVCMLLTVAFPHSELVL